MSPEGEAAENLFSYGTLQTEAVQLATFGRALEGTPDILVGYRLTMLRIRDQNVPALGSATHHRNIQFTGVASDVVKGTVFTVTEKELAEADAYEAIVDYQRVLAQLKSGMNAWVYLHIRQ